MNENEQGRAVWSSITIKLLNMSIRQLGLITNLYATKI